MHKRIKVFLGICSLTLLLCTGCASTLQEEMDTHLKPGLVEYDMPDDLEYQAAVEAENTVKKLAEQENVPPSLSDDFMQKYLDMSSFEELKQRTLEGIQITNDMANMSSAEISLWQQIIRDKAFNFYTTDDIDARSAELNGILDSIAASHQMTTQEFLASGDFGIDLSGARGFLDAQAARYATGFASSQSSNPVNDYQASARTAEASPSSPTSRTPQASNTPANSGLDDRTAGSGERTGTAGEIAS